MTRDHDEVTRPASCNAWPVRIIALGEGQAGTARDTVTANEGTVARLRPALNHGKPLYHFLPAEPALSFGTLGCNFSCFLSELAQFASGQRPAG